MDIRQSRVSEEYGKEERDLFPKDEASERKKKDRDMEAREELKIEKSD